MSDSTNTFDQYKDYTNICGSAFQPFVKNQIEERKKLVLKENRDPQTLQWLNNKTAWIRVSSGVNVDLDNQNFSEKGEALSKKYILQSGLVDYTNGYKLRSGIDPNGAYGIGGTDFGFRPMPGITSLSIKTGGKLGTLREATIDFVCYNKEQLDIMDALYMKLGMSVLVEWGHIPFIDNKGVLQNLPQPLPFYEIHSKEDLMIKIQENRVTHDGNFDAMWGTIKNWSFALEENGIWKCQMSLVGAGDVLESLKINQSGNSLIAEVTGSPYPVVTDANLSLLNNVLYKLWESTTNYNYNSDGYYQSNFNLSTNQIKAIQPYMKNIGINFKTPGNNYSVAFEDPRAEYGYQFSTISGLNTKLGNGGKVINIPKITIPEIFTRYIVPYEINGEEHVKGVIKNTDKGAEQVYITLSHLLFLIMATGGIFDKNKNKKDPYIYIDSNPETNRCYTFEGHISLDPTVCLIASQMLPFEITSKMFNALQYKFPYFDSNNPSMGRFMYTLINVQFIATVLKGNPSKNPKGDVYFVDFLQEILAGINKATGGFNEFRIVPDDDTRCIRIFDDKRVIKPLKNEDSSPYTVIPVMGKDSLAYSFSYTSRIPPNAATMIVISNQAEPTGVNMPDDALAFSKLRQGLTNRLASVRVDATDTTTTIQTLDEKKQAQLVEDERFAELRDLIKGIYNGEGGELTRVEKQKIVNQQAAVKKTQQLRDVGVNDERVNSDGTTTFTGPKY